MPSMAPVSGLPISAAPAGVGVNATNTIPCTGAASRLMNARIRTKRKVTTKSGTSGGNVYQWVDHIDGVCAALQVDSASESERGQRPEVAETRLRLYCPAGADIQTHDRVYPLTGIYKGKAFAVESGAADDAGYEAYGKWRIRRLEGGGTR